MINVDRGKVYIEGNSKDLIAEWSQMTRVVVRHYPDKKKPCLVIEQGNQGMILATFQNEKCEEIYKRFLQGNCMQREMSWLFDEDGSDAE